MVYPLTGNERGHVVVFYGYGSPTANLAGEWDGFVYVMLKRRCMQRLYAVMAIHDECRN